MQSSPVSIARAAAWREDRAERRNIPRKWVMSDDTLLALVKRNPVRVESLQHSRTDRWGAMTVRSWPSSAQAARTIALPLMVRGHRQISRS
ncbi:MAG: HRDC domain-containing protein [Collinsella sp.]